MVRCMDFRSRPVFWRRSSRRAGRGCVRRKEIYNPSLAYTLTVSKYLITASAIQTLGGAAGASLAGTGAHGEPDGDVGSLGLGRGG